MPRYAAGATRETFNPYAAGLKRYGPSGRRAPNVGRIGNMAGYRQRDNAVTRRNALLRKLKAQQRGAYASADALRK